MRNERRVLVVGSGGREQSIAQSLSNSATHVFIAPGNAGTNFLGDNVSNIDLHREDTAEIVDIVRKNDISMVIVGPESWLEKEIGDVLETEKIPAIAPQKDRAILELDKVYTRLKCNEWGVPQPKFAYFSKIEEALGFIRGNNLAEGVVKVSGPAMGKGVTVCNSANELESAIISAKKNFGKAADKILIEERLYGQEVSYIGICDGKTFLPFTPAMD